MGEGLREKIHEANIAVHRYEAEYYELLHPEVYGRQEQQRITFTLNTVDNLIAGNRRRALDFGAGTGNLTGKLLKMGYTVVSVDISAEMCAILRKRYRTFLKAEKLVVVNSSLEDVTFESDEFDLITCYSVLHHLPDYEGAVRRLSTFVRKGGVMYIAVKSQSIDVTKQPNRVYKEESDKLKESGFEVLQLIDLEPHEEKHGMIVAKR